LNKRGEDFEFTKIRNEVARKKRMRAKKTGEKRS
jgi:hypothetical protein